MPSDPAPAYPAALLGTFAPLLLGYSPHYERSTFMRAVIQAYGYELDAVFDVVEALPTHPILATCPEWVLPFWEQAYGLAPAADWTAVERRAALEAASQPVVTELEFRTYVAAMARCPVADVSATVVYDSGTYVHTLTVVLPGTLPTADYDYATAAAARIRPAHLAIEFDTV